MYVLAFRDFARLTGSQYLTGFAELRTFVPRFGFGPLNECLPLSRMEETQEAPVGGQYHMCIIYFEQLLAMTNQRESTM